MKRSTADTYQFWTLIERGTSLHCNAIRVDQYWELGKYLRDHVRPSGGLPKLSTQEFDPRRRLPMVWAFRREVDAIRAKRLCETFPSHRQHDAQSIGQYAVSFFRDRFPFRHAEITGLCGAEIGVDPRFGPGPGAGSIVNKVPSLIPRCNWQQNLVFGFEDCLTLVLVPNDERKS